MSSTAPAKPRSSDAAYLSIQDVVKDFSGYNAVDHVSLDIAKGEIFALLGSSGCGKTTLLRLLAGFDTPTSGRIVLNGQDLAGLPPYERPINMMFQSYALFPHLTVWQNIAFGLQRDKLPKDQVAQRVEAMLKLVQLGKFAQRKPHQLSGGQQQRVALARSLAKQPQMLLLDEPLGALDALTRIEMHRLIEGLWQASGFTALLVTHDVQEAVALADRVILIEDGRIALDETIALARPRAHGDAGFAALEKRILDRVLQRPQLEPVPVYTSWPGLPAHGLRWAV